MRVVGWEFLELSSMDRVSSESGSLCNVEHGYSVCISPWKLSTPVDFCLVFSAWED